MDIIKEYIEKNGFIYVQIEDESIQKITDLIQNGTAFEPVNEVEMIYLGTYFRINKDYELMKKYYGMAVDVGYDQAVICLMNHYAYVEKNKKMEMKYRKLHVIMTNSHLSRYLLGVYYMDVKKKYDKGEKYLLDSVDGEKPALIKLGEYYYHIKKDYGLAKVYYTLALEYSPMLANIMLGLYYYEKENKYELAKKHYLIGHELGHGSASNDLGYYYMKIENNVELAIKYLLIAIERGNTTSLVNASLAYFKLGDNINGEKYALMSLDKGHKECYTKMISHYASKSVKLLQFYIKYGERDTICAQFVNVMNAKLNDEDQAEFLSIMTSFEFLPSDNVPTSLRLFANALKSKIELIDLHFNYRVGGKGYEAAKADFLGSLL